MDTAVILLANQMKIASMVKNKETVFDTETKQIYYSTTLGFVPLLFENEHLPLTHISEKNMLTVKELIELDNYSFLQENNSIATVALQNFHQEPISTPTKKVQVVNGKTSETLQILNKHLTELSSEINFKIPKLNKTELQRIFNLKDYDYKIFSDKYTGTIKNLCEQIEAYTFSSLYTTKKTTLQNIEKDFETAKKYAYKGNVSELRKIRNATKNRRIKQTNNDKMNTTITKKANKKRRRILIIVATITIFAILALIKQISTAIIETPTPPQTVEVTMITKNNINETFEIYEQTNKTKVYEWRRENIIALLPLTQEEVFSMCNTDYIF